MKSLDEILRSAWRNLILETTVSRNTESSSKYVGAGVVDVITAWQELSMFLGSTAPGAGRPMVEITDQRVKRDKAGFDEWSFKRMKGS